jgi:hypothetical protein
VGILLILQSALRLFFFHEAAYAGVQLLQPMPPAATMNVVVNSVNLALGFVRLVVVPGLLLMTGWGLWGTVALSALTIVFDGVSSATVSLTAFAGLVLPAVSLPLLLPIRATILMEGRGP